MGRHRTILSCVQIVVPGQTRQVLEGAAVSARQLCLQNEYAQSSNNLDRYWESFLSGPWPPDRGFPKHPIAVLCWDAWGKRVLCCALWRRLGRESELDYIVCSAEMRGRGLAESALLAGESALWGLGVETASLEVSRENAPALHLYARLGYRTAGQRKNYYHRAGKSEDALVMTKTLRFPCRY